MNDDLHRYLDGDAETGSLDAETRREAELWDRLTASLRADPPGSAPPGLETRIMAEVRRRSPRRQGLLAWLLRPRTVRLSPLTMGGLAAAAVAVALMPRYGAGPSPVDPGAGGPETSVVYVQFMFQAPGARSVAVSGDFNQWAADTALQDADGDGVWTVRVPMEPGLHEYMFVIDGERWVTDPNADRYADDGFGNRNAVLAVALPEQSS